MLLVSTETETRVESQQSISPESDLWSNSAIQFRPKPKLCFFYTTLPVLVMYCQISTCHISVLNKIKTNKAISAFVHPTDLFSMTALLQKQ